jgi:hypothetical protein
MLKAVLLMDKKDPHTSTTETKENTVSERPDWKREFRGRSYYL